MKEIIRCTLLLIIVTTISSCVNYEWTDVKIESNRPFVLYKNYATIPVKMDSAYSKVTFTTQISKYEEGKKHYYAASTGYKPVKFKLHGKFRPQVFWNILFPPGFIWAHYTTLNAEKTNKFSFTKKSPYTASEYLKLAESTNSWKKQDTYLRKAIMQDAINTQGIALQASKQLLDISFKHNSKELENIYKTVIYFSPNDPVAQKYKIMNDVDVDFTEAKKYSATDYLYQAMSTKKWKKKRKYLLDAISIDSENSQGIALLASHLLLEVGYKHSSKTFKRAYKLSTYFLPNDEFATNYYYLKEEKDRRREERLNNIVAGMQAAATVLDATASVLPGESNAGYSGGSYNYSNSGNSNTHYVNKNNHLEQVRNVNYKSYDRIYHDYESKLIAMKTMSWPYQDGYNDSDRKRFQREMRNIRLNLNKSSIQINKSEMEDWNGK